MIGLVPLFVENFFYSYLTGAEYLSLFPHTPGYDTELWNRLFELPLDELIESYSTGMKRKLALMGVIKQNRPVVILDEPFNGLDMTASRLLMLILEHWRKQGRMIILTSHILESLTGVCDYIYLLKDRHIVSSWEKERFAFISDEVFGHMENEFRQLLGEAMGEE